MSRLKTLDEMRVFAQQQIALHAETGMGILTYDTAAGSVPLQSVLSKEEIELLSSLISSPVSSATLPSKPFNTSSYPSGSTRARSDGSAGGTGSVPSPDTSTDRVPSPSIYTGISAHQLDPLSPPVIDPKYFSHKFNVAFHALTTAWLRKWMHAEPISEHLINENAPGEDRVNTFDE
ncbi:hypothetical protein BJV78DRAFT_1279305 [Lactifluus subvellereus]|nr:hypothetical protein BJV78DRAFT_1279305 [Lactifluus subvellereus]